MAEKKFQYVSPDRPYGDPRQPYLLSYTTHDEWDVSIRFDSIRWYSCVFGHSVGYHDTHRRITHGHAWDVCAFAVAALGAVESRSGVANASIKTR